MLTRQAAQHVRSPFCAGALFWTWCPRGRWGHVWVASARPTAARPGHPRAWPACCARAGVVARGYRERFWLQHSPLPIATQLAQKRQPGIVFTAQNQKAPPCHPPAQPQDPPDRPSRRCNPSAAPGPAAGWVHDYLKHHTESLHSDSDLALLQPGVSSCSVHSSAARSWVVLDAVRTSRAPSRD